MLIFDYFIWHYLRAPKKILQIWGNYLRFFISYFIPVPALLKTLLAPWKRDLTSYGRGFDPKQFFETLSFNIISRGIGAVVRAIAIIFDLAVEAAAIIAGAIFFALWIFWPFVLVATLIYSGFIVFQPGLAKIGILAFLAFDLLTLYGFFALYKKSKEINPSLMSLDQILEQDWAQEIWERLGIQNNQVPQEVIDEPEKNLDSFLKQYSLKKEDFSQVLEWKIEEEDQKQRQRKFWERENLFNKGGIGRSWVYGWTNTLDAYSREYLPEPTLAHLVGREDEMKAMERILCKQTQSNVLLVGEPGVGKMTIVKQFTQLVLRGKTATPLAFRRVLNLDLNSALAGLTSTGEINQRLNKVFGEAAMAGNIILVIDEFHNFLSETINISPILAPFIEGSYFQLIALTTYENLHKIIERDPGLLKFFEKVEVKEPTPEQTLIILNDFIAGLEKRTNRKITYQALKEVVKTADRYIAGSPMPEKAIDLLEETAIYVAGSTSDYFVLPKHVDLVVSQKSEIPVGDLAEQEKEKLINLEEFLHRRIISQDAAIKEIASAMRRGRLGVAATTRPMGSFLFLGPTGVGKTETAKALAEAYFGSEQKMMRFDMSEYQGSGAIERMIGSSATQNPGILTTAVRENPFALLLLDEIEKADANILNLFLQVFDEGMATDVFGQKINFRNQIIIATSNAGSELIKETIQQGIDPSAQKQKILDYIQQSGLFRPEFLNRFDGIIIFQPLTKEDIIKIAKLNLENLAGRLKTQDIIFAPSDALAQKIAVLGFDPVFGARAMRRVIQDKVEDLIAKKLLAGEIQKQVPFEIKAEEIN